MSYIFKPPRPIEEYYIGKYDNGDCLYLITKEVYANWKGQNINVRHSCCLPEGPMDYSLRADSSYSVREFNAMPADWKSIADRDCTWLFGAFSKEPDPDQYYIATGERSGAYYFYLRKYDERSRNPAQHWVCSDSTTEVWNIINPKKFPQLSSNVKRELERSNSKRYKQWEDFYVAKYPGFKRLEDTTISPSCGCGICTSCLERLPLPDPKDDYLFCGVGGWVLIRRANLNSPNSRTEIHGYCVNEGWQTISKAKIRHSNPWIEFHNLSKNSYRDWSAFSKIVDSFEQYYSTKIPSEGIKDGSYKGSDFDIDKEELKANYNTKIQDLTGWIGTESNGTSTNITYNNNQPKYSPNLKQQNTMNLKNLLPNFEFGKVTTDKLALSFAGVAFKAQDGSYKTYDLKTKQLIDCGDLKFDVEFYKMPVQKLSAGDITELDGAYYIVEKVNEDGSFSGIVPTTGTRSNKLARNNIFGMYFYTKITSVFDMFGAANGTSGQVGNNPFGQMNPMMLMMMSDKDNKGGGMDSMMEMMLMSQMFGGGQGFNMFGQQPVVEQPKAQPAPRKRAPAKKAVSKPEESK